MGKGQGCASGLRAAQTDGRHKESDSYEHQGDISNDIEHLVSFPLTVAYTLLQCGLMGQ